MAAHDLKLKHPITYDAYNLCDMVSKSKLKSFLVSVLKEICDFLNIDVTDKLLHRKQPYVKKIESLYLSCVCQQ